VKSQKNRKKRANSAKRRSFRATKIKGIERAFRERRTGKKKRQEKNRQTEKLKYKNNRVRRNRTDQKAGKKQSDICGARHVKDKKTAGRQNNESTSSDERREEAERQRLCRGKEGKSYNIEPHDNATQEGKRDYDADPSGVTQGKVKRGGVTNGRRRSGWGYRNGGGSVRHKADVNRQSGWTSHM